MTVIQWEWPRSNFFEMCRIGELDFLVVLLARS